MRIKKEVSKENIFDKINSYDIFKKYVTGFQEIGKAFCSELREDRKPTCKIIPSNNRLIYRDFAETGFLDCFDYIQKKYNVGFQESMEMINEDFNLGLLSKMKIKYTPTPSKIYKVDISTYNSGPADIRVSTRGWNKYDKRFWNGKYGLNSSDLDEAKIFALSGFWINGSYIKPDTICYGYYFGIMEDGRQAWKIYQPYDKNFKWSNNCDSEVYQGYNLLPDTAEKLIITKSYKDVVVLRKIGYYAIAPQSESNSISEKLLQELKSRFKEIKLLYDNDGPGIEHSNRITNETGIPHFYMPEEVKDSSDYVEKYSLEELKTYIDLCWKSTEL